MTRFAIALASTAIAFLAVDAIWLRLMAGPFYRPLLGDRMAETFRLWPAIAFYLIYVVGIVTFAVTPALAAGRLMTALGLGALLGFVAYATYDLTNAATLKDWPVPITIVDMAWGTVSTGFAAVAGFAATRLATS